MLPEGILRILQTEPTFKALEQAIWELAAAVARRWLREALEQLDAQLMTERAAGLRHRGRKRRVLETLVGRVEVQRRRYQDAQGRWRYLLDESLGLPPEVQHSPGVVAAAVAAAVQVSYRQAAAQVRGRQPGGRGPSHGAIWRWAVRGGEAYLQREGEQAAALVERGELPPGGGRRTAVLFAEADEVRVPRQGPRRRRRVGEVLPKRRAGTTEVRILVTHAGWERRHPSSGEYRLRHKHVYAGIGEAATFWQRATVALHGVWQLEHVVCTVLNGDGASWIKEGLAYLPGCEYQADRWHLQQAVRVGLGWAPRARQALQEVLATTGAWEAVEAVLQGAVAEAPTPEHRQAVQGLRQYLWTQREGLRDYRRRALPVAVDSGWRGLGAAEGNVDKPWATRLTKRGMSWSTGLPAMVALLRLQAGEGLADWLEVSMGWHPWTERVRGWVEEPGGGAARQADGGEWLQVRLPAMAGKRTQLTEALRAMRG